MITARQIFSDLNLAQRAKVLDYLKTNNTSRRIFRVDFKEAFYEDLLRRREGSIAQHLIINTFGETGTLKSGINLEIAKFMDKNFTAEKIGFTDQEFLDLVGSVPKKSFCMRDEVVSAGTYGFGSSRVQAYLTIQTETLRQNEISIATISPTEKPLATAHYILHSIGCNKFEVDDQGIATVPVYVLVGVMNPSTHNYLGSLILEIDWMSKIWKEYQVKKNQFLKKVQDQDFAKADMGLLAQKCMKDPLAKFAKSKHDWLIVIQRTHPSLTTEEMQMLFAMIKMGVRVKNGDTNAEFTEPDSES
jgi:hypothetical protein